MSYASDFRKFITSQYINAGMRIALAVLVPSLLLAHFGLLREYFLFPLGTAFVGGTDQPGPFIRRRNTLIFACFCFVFVAFVAAVLKDHIFFAYAEILIFGMFFSMIGVYGQRLAAVGSFALIVLGIFIDGHLTGTNILKNMGIFFAGCLWFVVVLLILARIRPYKLASQMVGENYLELADFLKLKAGFYAKNPDFEKLTAQTISAQIKIRDLQEATREVVFKTREIVKESTTTSRLLMLMFLNSIDLHEKLMTSESEYRKLHENFEGEAILPKIGNYLVFLSEALTAMGIALQSGTKAVTPQHFSENYDALFHDYFELRNRAMRPENLENFMVLRQILARVTEIVADIKSLYGISAQDTRFAKSLSTGLDYERFVPDEAHLNFRVLKNNLSLKSEQFLHAIRLTVALLLGFTVSKFFMLGFGHTYWILITIIAIMKPAFSITKSRNVLRVAGTFCGGIFAYLLIYVVHSEAILFLILLASIALCYSLLRVRYFWAVFFMTAYILLSFNFLKPGNAAFIFRDRLVETAVGAVIAFLVSYFVLPVWEHTKTQDLMIKVLESNRLYFDAAINTIAFKNISEQHYKLKRKTAIIDLANLSDNFQKMLSDPKHRQKRMQALHQFVNTSQLCTAYIASLAQFGNKNQDFPEIDFENWSRKIDAEFLQSGSLLKHTGGEKVAKEHVPEPEDAVENLLLMRKNQLQEEQFYDRRDTSKISRLTELKNIREILGLIYNAAREQRKVLQKFYANEQP